MHYKVMVLTQTKPTENELRERMSPYKWKSGEDNHIKPFSFDSYTVGGRYSGSLHYLIPSEFKHCVGEDTYFYVEDILNTITVGILDHIKKSNDSIPRIWNEHFIDVDYLWLYLLDEGNQFVRCDGAYIRNLDDFHLDPNYFWAMVKLDGSATAKERFNDEDWEHDPTFYDEAVQELAEAAKNNAYITILDIHV